MKIIIEENIWNIYTKKPIRRCILTKEGNVFTRQLYNINDYSRRNDCIDTIDLNQIQLKINLMDAKNLSIEEIGEYIKKLTLNYDPDKLFEEHFEGEIGFFENPTIIRE